MPEKVDRVKPWAWLSRSDLKVGTEALLFAAQEKVIRTNYVKNYIDKSRDSPLCKMCGKRGESIQHIVSECDKLAQKWYKRCHDNFAKKVHRDLCRKHGLEHSDKWYEHTPEGIVENEAVKIMWDIQCNNVIQARRPDVIVIHKEKKEALIVGYCCTCGYEDCRKRVGEGRKVPRSEKGDKKVVGTAMCKSCSSSDWCPWKRYKDLNVGLKIWTLCLRLECCRRMLYWGRQEY